MLAIAGVVVFALAVVTMQDSWRAGIAVNDQAKLITVGICLYSRNPAFLGFDLVYIGLLLMFFNWPLLAFSAFTMLMLHLQILQEGGRGCPRLSATRICNTNRGCVATSDDINSTGRGFPCFFV